MAIPNFSDFQYLTDEQIDLLKSIAKAKIINIKSRQVLEKAKKERESLEEDIKRIDKLFEQLKLDIQEFKNFEPFKLIEKKESDSFI